MLLRFNKFWMNLQNPHLPTTIKKLLLVAGILFGVTLAQIAAAK